MFFYLKNGRSQFGFLRHETRTRYSLKATTKMPPPPTLENKHVPILRSQNTQNTRTPLKIGSEQSVRLLFIGQWNFDPFQLDQPKTRLTSTYLLYKLHSKTTYFRAPQGQTSRYDRLADTPRTQDRCPHRVLPTVSESPETRVLLKIQCQWSFTEVCSRLKFSYTPKFTTM